MHSFLIASLDKNLSSSYTASLLKESGVNPLDINLQVYEKAVGIEDVRDIQKAILLKPFRGKTKAVVIDTYADITPQAQNALLKILEEPPANTIMIITTSKKELILPTIISRCKVIILQEDEIKLVDDDLSKFQDILSVLSNGKTGDKLKIAQDITADKGDAARWLEKMAIFLESKLKQNDKDLNLLSFLKRLQITYKAIKSTNVSSRVALESLFLSF